MGIDPTGEFLIGLGLGAAISGKLRGTKSKATLAGGAVAGALIDGIALELTRSLLWTVSLSADPVRRLTSDEATVLEWLHKNANHAYSNGNVSSVLNSVRLYDGADLGIGDYTSLFGGFAKGAIDGVGAFPAGAVTIAGDIFFASNYNVGSQWLPSSRSTNNISLLAHETMHSLQFDAAILNRYSFGPWYLYETGRFGYHASFPEIEGHAMQDAVNDLLAKYPGIINSIVSGSPPAGAAKDLAAFYQKHYSNQKTRYGR